MLENVGTLERHRGRWAAETDFIVGGLIWGIISVLFVLWLLGFALHFGGGLIHILLVVAVILVVVNLLTGRGARI